MDTKTTAVEFGSNGAVLNSDTMTAELAAKYKNPERVSLPKLRPQIWPASALLLMMVGVFMLGARFAIGDFSREAFWLNWAGIAVLLLAGIWRDVWSKYLRR